MRTLIVRSVSSVCYQPSSDAGLFELAPGVSAYGVELAPGAAVVPDGGVAGAFAEGEVVPDAAPGAVVAARGVAPEAGGEPGAVPDIAVVAPAGAAPPDVGAVPGTAPDGGDVLAPGAPDSGGGTYGTRFGAAIAGEPAGKKSVRTYRTLHSS